MLFVWQKILEMSLILKKISFVTTNDMDPNYEITKDREPIGENAIDFIIF